MLAETWLGRRKDVVFEEANNLNTYNLIQILRGLRSRSLL